MLLVDKPSQVAKCMEIQSSSIVAKKSEVPTIGQPSKDKSTKKSTESNPQSIEVHAAASSGISCLSLKDHGAETKGKEELKNQHVKREASQPPQCGIKASSNSRKRQNEEPIASTLRPPFKTERVGGGINVNNPTGNAQLNISNNVYRKYVSHGSKSVCKWCLNFLFLQYNLLVTCQNCICGIVISE